MTPGLHEQAIDLWQRAGQYATEPSAHKEAIAHLNAGIEILPALPETSERTQRELQLLILLGPALIALKGYGAPEVARVYTRARELSRQVDETGEHFSILYGLYMSNYGQGAFQAAREVGETALGLAHRLRDPSLVLVAHWWLAGVLVPIGEFAMARNHLEQGIAAYDPQQHQALAFRYGHDPAVGILSFGAWALWSLGYPRQALQRSHEAHALAQDLSHPYTQAFALYLAILRHWHLRKADTIQELADTLMTTCAEQGFTYLMARATILQGWALVEQGHGAAGITRIHQGLAASQATGTVTMRSFYLTVLADACGKVGQVDDGLRAVDEALRIIDTTGEGVCAAELHRLKGELFLKADGGMRMAALTPEACFCKAIEIAHAQQAKSWELRAATSLARLWQSQGKRQEAYDLLAPVYGWFTEGFDTADLQDAKALLEELQQ